MEQEYKNKPQESSAGVVREGLTEYRVYEHPLLPKRIVRIGLCWPALLVGPAYLIYRRLWVPLSIWIVFSLVVGYLASQMSDALEADTAYGICLLIASIILWIDSNDFWEKDLTRRGYRVMKSLQARSMDEALAILERERLSLLPSTARNDCSMTRQETHPVTHQNISNRINEDSKIRSLTFTDFALFIFLVSMVIGVVVSLHN